MPAEPGLTLVVTTIVYIIIYYTGVCKTSMPEERPTQMICDGL